MTITDSIDVCYYLFNGEQVPQEGELAQMVEHSLRKREVLGSMPRLSNLYRSCNYCLPQENIWKQIGFCDVNIAERLKTDAIVWYFCTDISQGLFAPTRISLLQLPSLSFSQFVTITDSIDVYYYLFDGEPVCHQEELARMVELT